MSARLVPLREICSPKQWPALARAQMTETGHPVYGANGVIGFSDQYTHAEPTILVGCRGSIGTIHVTRSKAYATSNTMALDKLRGDLVDLNYLALFLAWRGFQDVVSGSSQPQLTRQNMLVIQVPLPTLHEQRRIAAIIDQAGALRAKRWQYLTRLDDLGRSVFTEQFVNPTNNGAGWPLEPLGLLAVTTSGGTPSRSEPGNYGGTIPWVKSGELHTDVVLNTEEHLTRSGLNSSAAKLMPVGTVLVAMYGATAGAVSILGIDAATNQAICSIAPGPRLDRHYLVAALRDLKASLLSRRSGGAQPNLSQNVLRSVLISVPPLSLQRQFGERAQAINVVRAQLKEARAQETELFHSLQSRAFSEAGL